MSKWQRTKNPIEDLGKLGGDIHSSDAENGMTIQNECYWRHESVVPETYLIIKGSIFKRWLYLLYMYLMCVYTVIYIYYLR